MNHAPSWKSLLPVSFAWPIWNKQICRDWLESREWVLCCHLLPSVAHRLQWESRRMRWKSVLPALPVPWVSTSVICPTFSAPAMECLREGADWIKAGDRRWMIVIRWCFCVCDMYIYIYYGSKWQWMVLKSTNNCTIPQHLNISSEVRSWSSVTWSVCFKASSLHFLLETSCKGQVVIQFVHVCPLVGDRLLSSTHPSCLIQLIQWRSQLPHSSLMSAKGSAGA